MRPYSASRVATTVVTLAVASMVSACAAGGRSRSDDSGGNETGARPYTPGSAQTPVTPGMQDPVVPVMPAPELPEDGVALDPSAPIVPPGSTQLGAATMGGAGQSQERYHKADVTRNGDNYFLMTNGWGPNFGSQSISWSGTSFTVESMTGSQGDNYEPASYPTVFCGQYSQERSGECGLPAALDSLTSLRTGWSWNPNNNDGEYNAAYDVWMGTGPDIGTHSGYLMVWYREPPGQQPAGSLTTRGVTVDKVPGSWDIWSGTVTVEGATRPIINWVRAEGDDTYEMEFNLLDFVRDAQARGLPIPGTHVLSVAVGFEIWNGPIEQLESVDFYVDVQ